MQLLTLLGLLFLLPFYIDRLTASPTPLLRVPSNQQLSTYTQSRRSLNNHLLPLLQREIPIPLGLPGVENIGFGWTAESSEYQAILPLAAAAEVLADFYHSIVTLCTAMIAQNTPLAPNGGIFHSGNLELLFNSTGAPVTWGLIRSFADWMLLTVDRGFLTTFTLWLTNIVTGQTIRFILRAEQGAPRLNP